MNSALTTEQLVNRLREAGLRVTPQRLAIYRALVSNEAHPTAQTLFRQLQTGLPSLSQATVYNTLQALADCGLIQQIGEVGGGAIRYDGNPAPHANLVCTLCHDVQDVVDLLLDDIVQQVVARAGFKAKGVRVTVYGQCARCQPVHSEGGLL